MTEDLSEEIAKIEQFRRDQAAKRAEAMKDLVDRHPSVLDMAEGIARSFMEMMESAPDAPEQERFPTSMPKGVAIVRVSSGWPERYIPEVELTGEKWLDTFADAKLIVNNGGLAAFVGTRGNGKTQMAAEIARAGYWPDDKGFWDGNKTVRGKTARYARAIDIFLDLRDANKVGSTRSEKDALARYEECGLLVIDEFQERGETEFENRVVTNLLDKRYGANKPTIIIANFDISELTKALGASVKDRMWENGKAFVFDWPSFRRQARP